MKDNFKITATIMGKEIEVGFEMPEGLTNEGYCVVFLTRYRKCLDAFQKEMVKAVD